MSCPWRGRRKNTLLHSIIENPEVTVACSDFEPQRIVLRDDFDIITLHRSIIAKLQHDYLEKSTLEERISYYRALASQGSEDAQYQIEKLQYKLEKFEKQTPDEFRLHSESFIKNYVKNKEAQRRGRDNVEERVAIICGYFDVARKYVDIDYRSFGPEQEVPWNQCRSCGEDISDAPISEENVIFCPFCASTRKLRFKSDSSPQEPKTNEACNTIIPMLHDFQGKNTPRCDLPSLLTKLDEYLQSLGHPPAEEIRAAPRLGNGKKARTDVQIMLNAMYECGYKKPNYVWFFCRELWGWQLQDISSLEETIFEDDRLLEKGYNEIPYSVRQRKSFIPLQVRLFFHLKRKKVTCDSSDFKLPSDMSRYNELLELSCKNVTGLEYVVI